MSAIPQRKFGAGETQVDFTHQFRSLPGVPRTLAAHERSGEFSKVRLDDLVESILGVFVAFAHTFQELCHFVRLGGGRFHGRLRFVK